MLQKLKTWMNSQRYNSHTMRLIVSGYIAYLGMDILLDLYKKGTFDLLLSAIAVIMILIGVPIAFISLYAVANGYGAEYKGKTNFFQPPERQKEEEDKSDM